MSYDYDIGHLDSGLYITMTETQDSIFVIYFIITHDHSLHWAGQSSVASIVIL